MSKAAKVISNTVYGIGVLIVIALGGIALFGSSQPANPDAMLPFNWKERAFIWLMFGAIPMLLACMAVYKFNAIKSSPSRKRNFILIFLPGFICSACALYTISVLLYEFLSYNLLR
jgi:nitric oxide reductase large subunit